MSRRRAPGVTLVLGALSVLAAVVLLAGWWRLGTDPSPTGSSAATWTAKEPGSISAATTRFTALVTQEGCNSGRTNPVLAPVVRTADDRVVVTVSVEGSTLFGGGATCQGNAPVEREVVLPEPLGARPLVDGTCRPYDIDAPSDCRRVPAP